MNGKQICGGYHKDEALSFSNVTFPDIETGKCEKDYKICGTS